MIVIEVRVSRSADSTPLSATDLLNRLRWLLSEPFDFPNFYIVFGLENYLYVLYGMGFATDLTAQAYRYGDREKAGQWLARRDQQLQAVIAKLPAHRDALKRLSGR